MTHRELVDRAARWLRGTARCGVVLTEAQGATEEVPDAIGWQGYFGVSTLVECKASRADFLADARKTFRQWGEAGVGRFRYFMVPRGLIRPDEVPARWGLLEVTTGKVRRTVKAREWQWENAGYCLGMQNEMRIMLSELRLVQIVQAGGTLAPTRSGRRVTQLLAATGA